MRRRLAEILELSWLPWLTRSGECRSGSSEFDARSLFGELGLGGGLPLVRSGDFTSESRDSDYFNCFTVVFGGIFEG